MATAGADLYSLHSFSLEHFNFLPVVYNTINQQKRSKKVGSGGG